MAIISIQRDQNNTISIVRMQVSDTLATVSGTDYILDNQEAINDLNGGTWKWFITDMVLVAAEDGNAFYEFVDTTFATLVIFGEKGTGTVNPGLQNNIPYYAANGNTLSPLSNLANAILATNGGSVPALTTTLPTAVQANITTVGTVGTGVWHGSAVTVPFGGSGLTSLTPYALLCGGTTGTANMQQVSGLGTTGFVLTSNGAGALPTWQVPAGSGTVSSGSANDLAFYQSTGTTVSPLTSIASGVLITSGLGVPSISQTLPSAVQSNITALGTIATGVWNGTVVGAQYGGTGLASITAHDLIIGNGTSPATLLAPSSTSGIPLVSQGASSDPAYSTAVVAGGGSGLTTLTAYAVLCGGTTSTGNMQQVSGVGTANQVLVSNGASALPTWQSVPGLTPAALTKTDDTNVTLTLGGTPATALLQATSITVGWTGTLGLSRGGLAAALTASNGGIFYSTASAGAILAGTATANQVLLSGSNTAPAWSTATYPPTTTINQLLYSSSTNVIAGVTAGNFGVLISSSSGVPSWLANGTTGQILTATTSGIASWANPASSSVTFTGDSGTPFIGNTLTVSGGSTGLSFAASAPNLTLLGVLKLVNGGTNNALVASAGGIVWSDSTKLNILAGTSTANQLLLSGNAATPSWSTSTYPGTNAVNTLLYASSANVMAALATANSGVLVTSAGGVPSISTTLPTGLAMGTPASLVLTNATGLPVAGGGTGNSTFTAYSVICAGTTSTGAFQNVSGLGTTGFVLTSNGVSALPTWQAATGTGTVNSGTINQLAWYAATGTAVSGLTTANSGVLVTSAGGVPSISSTLPAFTTSSITFNPTTGGIVGTTTNDNTAAGKVGEYVSSAVLFASAVAFTSTTVRDITSISLTAGDWDVTGSIFYNFSLTAQGYYGWASSTSATQPDSSLISGITNVNSTIIDNAGQPILTRRFSLAGTTTIYLSGVSTFSAGTGTGCGYIAARRVR